MKLIRRIFVVGIWILFIFSVLYFPKLDIFPYQEKSLNIFVWGDILDAETLQKFEEETGIKVHISYYSSNEELLVKMKATKGEDYDLIMPSDYTVSLLIKAGLLKPLNHSKLSFFSELNPALLNHSFDPDNRYSIPFEWEVFGLGVDTNYFKNRPLSPSWAALYDPEIIDYKIAMNNDPIEAILFAAFYLFGKTDSLSKSEFQEVKLLLLNQRTWVEAYTDARSDYYIATGNCPVTLSNSPKIKQAKKMFSYIDFVIPEEGTFVTIENFCIPKASKKQAYAYQLLNHLYTEESMLRHYEEFGFFPAMLTNLDELKFEEYERKLLALKREDFERFHFIKNIMPHKEVLNLWVEVKSF